MSVEQRQLGPSTAPNWGWAALPALLALLVGAGAIEATLSQGMTPRATLYPLGFAALSAIVAWWVLRQPPFEQTTLRLTETGVSIAGRRTGLELAWDEIAAVTYRASAIGAPHMTIERAAGVPDDDEAIPGVLFPVKATGARMEDIVAFLAKGAAEAGYTLAEAGAHDRRAIYGFPGPRRWTLYRTDAAEG